MSCDEDLFPEHPQCPIGTTRGRLEELHHFWHEAETNYHDHRKFRASINAAIQAARNVTFALQSAKARIPDFDNWYEGWRARLKEDPTMAWLQQARNIVVKKGDLEVHSLAQVSLKNWLDWRFKTVPVPPFLTAEGIVGYLTSKKDVKLPTPADEDAVLCVERRWSTTDFPNRDFLEVLAHGFSVLHELVADAHARASQRSSPCPPMTLGSDGALPVCMRASGAPRTAYLDVKSRQQMDMKIVARPRDPQIDEEALKRYGIPAQSAPKVQTEDDVFKYAEWLAEAGKRLLTADGIHYAMAFLILPGGEVKIIGCAVPDQPSKYIAYREIANEVERTGATAVIYVNEIWWIPTSKWDGKQRAGQHPERQEALMVVVETASGRNGSYTMPFTRDGDGKFVFGETEVVMDRPESGLLFLNPIRDVWAKKRGR